jgi:hypothetical protein
MIETALPSYDQVVASIAAAERGDGWLAACEAADRFLAINLQFVDALAEHLRKIGSGPVLEICAGRGELADALISHGVDVTATDRNPPPGSSVRRVDAVEALRRYQPTTVLGCFVPFDADVDRAVLAAPSVRSYVVLNARVGGELGDRILWRNDAWVASPLPAISRWMICRHDVWMGSDKPVIQHGEAWLLERRENQCGG